MAHTIVSHGWLYFEMSDAMDRECCLKILEMQGGGMLRLICNFWDSAINVCQAQGSYGPPFQARCRITQGGPMSARLFNILVDPVIGEWMRLMRETLDNRQIGEEERETLLGALFAIFYVEDGYIVSQDPVSFLQQAIDILLALFRPVGLDTITKKPHAMVCTPGKIYGSNS